MAFSQDQLLPGERLVLRRHQSLIVLFRVGVLTLVAAAVLVGLALKLGVWWIPGFLLPALAVLLWEIVARRRKEYIITSRRVVKQQGILSVHSFDAPLDKINNIFHEQNLIGRLLNFGNVGLETASEQGTTVFHCIPDPIGFKNAIVAQRETYKSAPAAVADGASRSDTPRLLEQLASLRDRGIITAAEFEAKKKDLLGKL